MAPAMSWRFFKLLDGFVQPRGVFLKVFLKRGNFAVQFGKGGENFVSFAFDATQRGSRLHIAMRGQRQFGRNGEGGLVAFDKLDVLSLDPIAFRIGAKTGEGLFGQFLRMGHKAAFARRLWVIKAHVPTKVN